MPALLHFVADWSGPSRQHRLDVAEAATQLGLRATEVDVDQDPETAQRFGVHDLPAVALMSDGDELLDLVVGAVSAGDLVARLQPLIT